MKKLVTATLVLLVLAAFPGLSAAQEKKQAPDKPKGGQATIAYPNADRLTLSLDPKVASIKKECRVIARPWYSKDNARKYPRQPMFFEKIPSSPPNPQAPAHGETDINGVLHRTVISGQKIRAVLGIGPPKAPGAVVSNWFTCNAQPPTQ
jgi:hypothetical protein